MRQHRAGSLGNNYQRASCPAGSGIRKLPNLTTAFLSKNQKNVNQLWRIKTVESNFKSQQQTISLAIVPHKEQTAMNFTSRPATSSKKEMGKGVSYLFDKQSAGISLNISLSQYLFPSPSLSPSNSLVIKSKPLTTPIFLNSDNISLHYVLLPCTCPLPDLPLLLLPHNIHALHL